MDSKESAWRMPAIGNGSPDVARTVKDIDSPYEISEGDEKSVPPFCYPGTTLSKALMGRATGLLSKQINAIGSHTHAHRDEAGNLCFREGEGGFEQVQRMEAQAIWMLASVLGGTPDTIDGYFCSGGTEANLQGIWIGREWLRRAPDPKEMGICVLTGALQHYSIVKATELLDIGHPQWVRCTRCGDDHLFMPDAGGKGVNLVGMNEKGEMSLVELERIFRRKYAEGFRRFMIVGTVGTTAMGSIDPIKEIGDFIDRMREETGACFYFHVDAAFGGFTVPFVNPALEIAFQVPRVMSMTVDGHKMGRLPYPGGIFLCRKDMMSLVARSVNYVRGHEDDTVSGSRSCLSAVMAWYLFQREGVKGQRRYVQACLDGRDRLVNMIQKELPGVVTVLPCSPWVNFAPMIIDLDMKNPGVAKILGPYHLRTDNYPQNPADPNSCPRKMTKVCIMPHNLPYLERFVADLKKADRIQYGG